MPGDADSLNGQPGSFYQDATNLNAGSLPAARFNDTSHGARAGGTLHAAATTSVAGFLSAADKTKLDGLDSADYQPVDPTLTSLSALGTASDRFAYTTGTDTWAEGTITAAGRALLDDASVSNQRTTLGLGTAATANTGTSGGTIPLLNAQNVWSNNIYFDGNTAGARHVAVTMTGDTLNTAEVAYLGIITDRPSGATVGVNGADVKSWAFQGIGNSFTTSGLQNDFRFVKFNDGNATIVYSIDFATPSINFNPAAVANVDPTIGGNKIWHAGNDGTGSTLDADLLDGAEGAAYAKLADSETVSGAWTFSGNLKAGGTRNDFYGVPGADASINTYITTDRPDVGTYSGSADTNGWLWAARLHDFTTPSSAADDLILYKMEGTSPTEVARYDFSDASLALSGTPTAPTASTSTDTTQIATTEFVHDVVDAAGGGYLPGIVVGGTAQADFETAVAATTDGEMVLIFVPEGTYTDDLTGLDVGTRRVMWHCLGEVNFTTGIPPGKLVNYSPINVPGGLSSLFNRSWSVGNFGFYTLSTTANEATASDFTVDVRKDVNHGIGTGINNSNALRSRAMGKGEIDHGMIGISVLTEHDGKLYGDGGGDPNQGANGSNLSGVSIISQIVNVSGSAGSKGEDSENAGIFGMDISAKDTTGLPSFISGDLKRRVVGMELTVHASGADPVTEDEEGNPNSIKGRRSCLNISFQAEHDHETTPGFPLTDNECSHGIKINISSASAGNGATTAIMRQGILIEKGWDDGSILEGIRIEDVDDASINCLGTGASGGAFLKLGSRGNNFMGLIDFYKYVDFDTEVSIARISSQATDTTTSSEDGILNFNTVTAGTLLLQMCVGDGVAIGPNTVAKMGRGSLNLDTSLYVDGTKVVGSRGAALPADATNLATAQTLVNAVKAALVAHGLVAA